MQIDRSFFGLPQKRQGVQVAPDPYGNLRGLIEGHTNISYAKAVDAIVYL